MPPRWKQWALEWGGCFALVVIVLISTRLKG